MNHCGGPTTSGRASPLAWENGASARVVGESSLGSRKKSSAWPPLLVMVTGTVTGWPAGSVVLALSGMPAALSVTALNAMLPENGWDTSSPTTGLAKSTISVQVPWMGLTAHADSVVVWL